MSTPPPSWRPASRSEVEAIVAEHLRHCTCAQRALFADIRIPPTTIPIDRLGQLEQVFAVARHRDAVLFWEDVDEGFELAVPDADGVLREYGASQLDLSHVLTRLHREGGATR